MAEELTLGLDSSPWARDIWWSRRRLRYNVALIVAGVLGFLSYGAAVDRCISLRAPGDLEITIFTTFFQAFAYLIMIVVANICYFLGPLSERVLQPGNITRYRRVTFQMGLWFSVLLPFTPAAILLISCSLHRGEAREILSRILMLGPLS